MRNLLVALTILLGSTSAALAQFSVGVVVSGVSIGINLPVYPELVRVPGYPVYYAPRANSNYFFYDGYYWVFAGNNWYFSDWYNGPWQWVPPEQVPLFILRIPVGYYRLPPPFFRGWSIGEPPHWGEHWGRDWAARHGGWDRWDRRSAPPPAPLPLYQRQFSGDRYPHRPEEQRAIRADSDRYQPRESALPPPAGQPGPRQFAPPERRDEGRDQGRDEGRHGPRDDRRGDGPPPAWQPPASDYAAPARQRQEPPPVAPGWSMQPPAQAQPMPPRQQMQGGMPPWVRGDGSERPRETPRAERGNDAVRDGGRDARNEPRRNDERRNDDRGDWRR